MSKIGAQKGEPAMEDLECWAHHQTSDTLVDDVLQRAWNESISFVFSQNVEGNKDKLKIGN